jgi:hypothetical protein
MRPCVHATVAPWATQTCLLPASLCSSITVAALHPLASQAECCLQSAWTGRAWGDGMIHHHGWDARAGGQGWPQGRGHGGQTRQVGGRLPSNKLQGVTSARANGAQPALRVQTWRTFVSCSLLSALHATARLCKPACVRPPPPPPPFPPSPSPLPPSLHPACARRARRPSRKASRYGWMAKEPIRADRQQTDNQAHRPYDIGSGPGPTVTIS